MIFFAYVILFLKLVWLALPVVILYKVVMLDHAVTSVDKRLAAIERQVIPRERPANAPPTSESELEGLVRQGQMIDAINLYRAQTGADLREAKDAVEAMRVRL